VRNELERALAQLETEAAQRETATAQYDGELTQAQRQVAQLQGALAQARHELERRQVEDGAVVVEIAGARYSLGDASEALELSPTTLARKLKTVAQKEISGGRP
jgi:DNA-binding NtrC family response regulator